MVSSISGSSSLSAYQAASDLLKSTQSSAENTKTTPPSTTADPGELTQLIDSMKEAVRLLSLANRSKTKAQKEEYRGQLANQITNIQNVLFGSSSNNGDAIIGDNATQGQVGDCYLITGLNGVCQGGDTALKDAVKNQISVNTVNGTINVKFVREIKGAKGAIKKVTVNQVVTATGLQQLKDRNYVAGNAEAMTNVIERAYSQYRVAVRETRNNVLKGHEGGNTSKFLAALTGKKAYVDTVFNKDLATLDAALQNYSANSGRYILAADTKSVVSSGLVGSHAYYLKGYDSSSQTVSLVNPWNSAATQNISLSSFQQNFGYFDGIDVAA